ncbi:poly-gamma-glutamate biosynthesis protein PgsC/CapC [Halobellus marinus]|uniref:poly-gamma-glutamate biosynthesis protein PgsC/CapC n=1 Tax=Halobellus TaxID=1073986 RepID=UPI0028AC2E50|nr:poly-gamma-glutamate biosynthesis protein PgsC/CapC [Halobellus sp. DFY28]
MWVATLLAVVGLLGVAVTTQFTGYRLGGSITVPVLAVYTLKNVLMLPVFVLSTIAAYIGLWYLRRRTLIYGRDELLAAFVIGTSVPLVVILGLIQVGFDADIIVLIGSILPGLAAYNYHSIKPEFRRNDLLATVGLFTGLIVLGLVLVSPGIATRFGTVTPPVLFAATADVAVYNNAVVDITTEAVVISREIIAGLFIAGLIISERIRSRFGVRVGIITAVLLAVYANTNYWLIIMYVILLVLAFGFVQAVNYATLRYGRVLLGTTTAFALLMAVPLTLSLPIGRGLSAFFVAFLAGITAYNAHVTGSFDRRLVLPLQAVVFVPAVLVIRLFSAPEPLGIPQELTLPVILTGILVVVVGVGIGGWYSVAQPDETEVQSVSVLSGDDS